MVQREDLWNKQPMPMPPPPGAEAPLSPVRSTAFGARNDDKRITQLVDSIHGMQDQLSDVYSDVQHTMREFTSLTDRSRDNGLALEKLMTEIKGVRSDDGVSKKLTGLAQLDMLKELDKLERLTKLDEMSRAIEQLQIGSRQPAPAQLDSSSLRNLAQLQELAALQKLQALDTLPAQLARLDDLQELQNLQKLSALDGLQEHLPLLANLKQLDGLNERETGAPKELQQLSALNKLSQLDQLDKLSQLDQLKILSKLQGLDQLEKLNSLDKLDSLDKLGDLKALQHLDTFSDFKEDVSGRMAEIMGSLTRLDSQQANSTRSLESSESLKQLDKLQGLSSLAELDGLKQLSQLSQLSQLEQLGKLDVLAEFDNRCKQLDQLQQLQQLKELEKLRGLESVDFAALSTVVAALSGKVESIPNHAFEVQGEIRAVQDHLMGAHDAQALEIKQLKEQLQEQASELATYRARVPDLDRLLAEHTELVESVKGMREQEKLLIAKNAELKTELKAGVDRLLDTERRYQTLETSVRELVLSKYKGILGSGTLAVLDKSEINSRDNKENDSPIRIPKRQQMRSVSLMSGSP